MSLIGFIISTFLVLVLVGTVWAAGIPGGLDNRWPVALFIGAGLAGVRKILARAGEAAEIGFPVHPHQLRHATGYALANKGVDTRTLQHYMGHKKIEHTVRYSALDANRFSRLWDD